MIADKLASLAQVVRNCVDGKSAITQAVTSKGVATNPTDRWDDIAINIGLIEGGSPSGDVGYFDVTASSSPRSYDVFLSGDYSGIVSHDYYAVFIESDNTPSVGEIFKGAGVFSIHQNIYYTQVQLFAHTFLSESGMTTSQYAPNFKVSRLASDRLVLELAGDTSSEKFAEGSWTLKLIPLR